ncbi:unnamed protein product [Pieris macdunnoughi]|uniref:Carboxylic ester hydrolase n=1 Tax=Pieris macdunnoughi TaxID=345717 RepID=A0A821YB58_9NEOP|nr:unnamed protein product [Pieris macdunnoughi]
MMHALCLVIYWFVCVFSYVEAAEAGGSPTVVTPSGTILGSLMTSRRGRPIHAFRGIRYAEPPIGELRFRLPVLITKYKEEVNATAEGPACPQDADPGYFLDEDCLKLNVYKPGNRNSTSLLPVVVYIHAGGYYSVSGRSDVAGPHYLLDKDLLLVTINYRLGSLGFLSTGDEEAPGNNGFKDQVTALRWVKRNIESFGGDPNCVTLAGYSAGGMSVALHTVSPMSKGLFHRAISMSGSPFSQIPRSQELLSLALRQARLVDCPHSSTRAIVDCLRTVPWRKLGDSLKGFRDFSIDPIIIWRPVIERDFGQERFLTEDAMVSIREGRISSVPFIVSQTRDEFFWEAFLVLDNFIYTSLINSDWYRVSPIAFMLPSPSDDAAAVLREAYAGSTCGSTRWTNSVEANIGANVWSRPYVGNQSLENNTEDARNLGKLYGDAVIGFGVHRLVNLLSYQSQPTYRFVFEYMGNRSHYEDPATRKPVGVAHHDELIYLFSLRVAFEDIPLSPSHDSVMVDKLTTIVYNFARTGDPNPLWGTSPPTWVPFTPSNGTHLSISEQYTLGQDWYKERYRIWEQLYPLDYSLASL